MVSLPSTLGILTITVALAAPTGASAAVTSTVITSPAAGVALVPGASAISGRAPGATDGDRVDLYCFCGPAPIKLGSATISGGGFTFSPPSVPAVLGRLTGGAVLRALPAGADPGRRDLTSFKSAAIDLANTAVVHLAPALTIGSSATSVGRPPAKATPKHKAAPKHKRKKRVRHSTRAKRHRSAR